MRGCLSFLVFVAVLVGALVWLALPPIADVVVTEGLAAALGGRVAAHVETSFPPSLLTLHADRVTISGGGIRAGGVTAAGLDLRLDDVDLLDRRAASLHGTLTDVLLPVAAAPGGVVAVPRVELSGPTWAIDATLSVGARDVRDLVAAAVERAVGRSPDEVSLAAPDRLRVVIGPTTLTGRVAVRSGALVALLDGGPVAAVTLVGAGETGPLTLTRAGVSGADLLLGGTLDGSALGLSPGGP